MITPDGSSFAENVAWQSEDPTPVVKQAVENGLIKASQAVVDIGCGFGGNANFLASKGVEVTAVNINRRELAQAQKKTRARGLNVSYVEASATAIPLATDSQDTALDLGCTHMLDRPSQEKAAGEIARVIKSGGHLIYFGFSKDHPAFQNNPGSPMFRGLGDIQQMYGGQFEVVRAEITKWKPKPEEKASFSEHIGLTVIMKKKT